MLAIFAGVSVYAAGAPTISFSANPSSVVRGQAVALSWNSTNSTYCVLSGGWKGQVSPYGSQNRYPEHTTDYAASCTGPQGTASAKATVQVTDAPVDQTTSGGTTNTITQNNSSALTSLTCNASPSSARVGQAVTFSAHTNAGVTVATFSWDGAIIGTGKVRTVNFGSSGTKTAIATGYDQYGNSRSSACSVTVLTTVATTPAPTSQPQTPPRKTTALKTTTPPPPTYILSAAEYDSMCRARGFVKPVELTQATPTQNSNQPSASGGNPTLASLILSDKRSYLAPLIFFIILIIAISAGATFFVTRLFQRKQREELERLP